MVHGSSPCGPTRYEKAAQLRGFFVPVVFLGIAPVSSRHVLPLRLPHQPSATLPPLHCQGDCPRHRLLAASVVSQQAPAQTQLLSCTIQRQPMLGHPVPDKLMRTLPCLFDRAYARVGGSKLKIVVTCPDDRVVALTHCSRCEYLRVGKRSQRCVFRMISSRATLSCCLSAKVSRKVLAGVATTSLN